MQAYKMTMIHGPQGSGKTMIARAMLLGYKQPVYIVSGMLDKKTEMLIDSGKVDLVVVDDVSKETFIDGITKFFDQKIDCDIIICVQT